MINERLLKKLNEQVNFEYYSSHLYFAMEAYFRDKDLPGFANFFKVQVEEERLHGRMIFDYIYRMNGNAVVAGFPTPETDFGGIIEAFKHAYAHERVVTSKIYDLMDIALEERDHATVSFLKWFVDEQVEEEDTFLTIIKRLEFIGKDINALYNMDVELSQRVFTPPAQQQ